MRSFDSITVKMVEPYMTIMSKGRTMPTLSASEAASIVPAMTGVPAARPVARAAFGVTWPAISVVHKSFGKRSSSIRSPQSSPLQSWRSMR